MDEPLDLNRPSDLGGALNLGGKVAIVTGGGKGIGRGISERLLQAGAEVLICGRSEPQDLPRALLHTLSHNRPHDPPHDPSHDPSHNLPDNRERTAHFFPCDVRDADQVQACVDHCVKTLGRLDILVNNAGGSPRANAADASPRFSEAIIRLNLIAPLNFAQAANAVMQTQDSGGCIINIASVSTLRPSPGTAAYGAAKAGLVNLGESLAVEWAPKVRVNAIICGLTQTEQSHLHYGDAAGIAAVGATIPLGRMAVPGDVGDACLFLASPLASYISGASIALHGGGEKPAFLYAANADTETKTETKNKTKASTRAARSTSTPNPTTKPGPG